MNYIHLRHHYLEALTTAFETFPIVALIGPRQCGKTTLAKQFTSHAKQFSADQYYDLEDFTDLERLHNPKLALEPAQGLVVIDEIQRLPNLFPTLRVLADQHQSNRQFLILGSASQHLIQQASESLAGRIQYIELTPFSATEVSESTLLWQRGGFPKSYFATSDEASQAWREAYIRTYLEQDLPNLGIRIPALSLRRFWMMLTHYHGNIFNASEIGKSLGISDHTAKRYVDILTGTFMVRTLLPWYENINKRQVKSPKIYFRDSGLYHSLLNIPNHSSLLRSPKLGASWEGMALEEICRFYEATPEQCYFWSIHNEAELDLLIIKDGKRLGFEFKYTDHPQLSKSIHSALKHLQLDRLTIIVPGNTHFQLDQRVYVAGLNHHLNLKELSG